MTTMNSQAVSNGYEYRGLMAETWDMLRGDPSGRFDRDFYAAMIEGYGQPVLDVGCGTGRLLLDFLAAGIEIDGVDVSPEMLTICGEKGLQLGLSPLLYQQAIEELALPRQYRTILAPSSVLQLIVDPATVLRATMRLYAHLLPGGALIAPFMTLWREGMELQQEWEHAAARPSDGAMLQRMGRVTYDPATECEHTEDLYQVVQDGTIVASELHRRSPANRSYTPDQAYRLFSNAGFEEIRVLRGYTGQPVSADAMLFTLIGVKPLATKAEKQES